MITMGFIQEELEGIYKLCSVILLFGQLTVIKDPSYVKIKDIDDGEKLIINDDITITQICNLLNINKNLLINKLTYRAIVTNNEYYIKRLTLQEVQNTIHTISKTIYNKLFNWIVFKINNTLHNEQQQTFIGILDIFGFEVFKNNSFEQLCINFTNEMLQEQFNYFIFKKEQELYKKENIKWDIINYPDNKQIINLFLKKPIGLFHLLNDSCQLHKDYTYFYNSVLKLLIIKNFL